MAGQGDESMIQTSLNFFGKIKIKNEIYWFKVRWMNIREKMSLKSYQGAAAFYINMLKGHLTYYQYTQFLWLQSCWQWKKSSASHL